MGLPILAIITKGLFVRRLFTKGLVVACSKAGEADVSLVLVGHGARSAKERVNVYRYKIEGVEYSCHARKRRKPKGASDPEAATGVAMVDPRNPKRNIFRDDYT